MNPAIPITLIALLLLTCVACASAPPQAQPPTPEPTAPPTPTPAAITVLCVGSMTGERAAAIIDGVPADLWSFAITVAQGEGVDWQHGADRIPTQPGQGDIPVPIAGNTVALGAQDDITVASNQGVAISPARSVGVLAVDDIGYSRALVIHELLHCEPGVAVLHTDSELEADPGYREWAAHHPHAGDAMTRGNAYGVWQARLARTTDYHQE